ncbi:acyltransferase [Thermodesulfobacteriota bacterium]
MRVISHLKRYIWAKIKILLNPLLNELIQENINNRIRVWGDPSRLRIHQTAAMVNTLINTRSGYIDIDEFTFTGHGVSIVTGTHNYNKFLNERMTDIPRYGGDIRIGKGVWIGSSALILGPCVIEDHAVVAAGSVVIPNTHIESYAIYGGVPARFIKTINITRQTDTADEAVDFCINQKQIF